MLTPIRYYFIPFLLILSYSLKTNAQKPNINPRLKFQMEIGMNYTNFLDGIPGDINGPGTFGFNLRLRDAFQDRGLPILIFNEYFSCKMTYKHHRINFSYWASVNNNKDFTPGKRVGLSSKEYKIYASGYGFQKDFLGIKWAVIGNICYRQGEEYAIHAINTGDVVTGSWMVYQKPWGWMVGLEAEYLVTKNIGIGVNIGYYHFPFEDARLIGNFIEIMNPKMQAESKPTKQLLIGSVKLIYTFALPSFKKKK